MTPTLLQCGQWVVSRLVLVGGQRDSEQEQPSYALPRGCCVSLQIHGMFWQRQFRPDTKMILFILCFFSTFSPCMWYLSLTGAGHTSLASFPQSQQCWEMGFIILCKPARTAGGQRGLCPFSAASQYTGKCDGKQQEAKPGLSHSGTWLKHPSQKRKCRNGWGGSSHFLATNFLVLQSPLTSSANKFKGRKEVTKQHVVPVLN